MDTIIQLVGGSFALGIIVGANIVLYQKGGNKK